MAREDQKDMFHDGVDSSTRNPAPPVKKSMVLTWPAEPDRNWHDLQPYIHELTRVADAIEAARKGSKLTKNWTPDGISTHLMGLMGAKVMELETGVKMNTTVYAKGGDPGYDFLYLGYRWDVKATRYWETPNLLHYPKAPCHASIYCCTGIDLERVRGCYIGYATRRQVEFANIRSFRHGDQRCIPEGELIAGWPEPAA